MQFYYVRLVSPDGDLLASETLIAGDGDAPDFGTPEEVARGAANLFTSDQYDENAGGNLIHLFGPFNVDQPSNVFAIEDDPRGLDAPDWFTATPVALDLPPVALEPTIPPDCFVVLLEDPDGADSSPWPVRAPTVEEAVAKARKAWADWLEDDEDEEDPPAVVKVYPGWLGVRLDYQEPGES